VSEVVFLVISVLTVFFAMMVVRADNLVHSAIYLAGAFIGTAGLFLLLKAEFVAWAQVLVYVGAVVTLILFTIMLTRKGEAE
jgi:NADH-quinone oxidoreductase subunit J